MKKNLNALMLLGMALTLGAGSMVRAGDIRHETRNPEGSSFKSGREYRVRYERRERASKDSYAAEVWRDERDETFEEYRRGEQARGFSSDVRLKDDSRADYIGAYEETGERARGISYREYFAHREHEPDKARDGHKEGHHPGHVRDASSRPERET